MNLNEELNKFRDRDLECLFHRKKLHLVLDLDHTLVHSKKFSLLTLEDKQLINPSNESSSSSLSSLHEILDGAVLVKFRPGVDAFLNEVSTLFDLSIFTMGCELYARTVARLLEDNYGNGFRFREVLSREDCLIKNKKSLELMLSHERVTVIVDDTEEVWKNETKPSYSETNLVKIVPYNFFSTARMISRSKLEGVEDEEAMDAELARVLSTLRKVHGAFYRHDDVLGKEDSVKLDYSNRDVRQVLKSVREEVQSNNGGYSAALPVQGRFEEGTAINRKRSHGACFDLPLKSCEPSKRFKACEVADHPCFAC